MLRHVCQLAVCKIVCKIKTPVTCSAMLHNRKLCSDNVHDPGGTCGFVQMCQSAAYYDKASNCNTALCRVFGRCLNCKIADRIDI